MSATNVREVIEGPQEQGADEKIFWTVDISGYGSSPSAYPVTVLDEDGDDVTVATTTGVATLSDATHVKTPLIHSLVAGTQYKVILTMTWATEIKIGFFILVATE
ncbi:MAG: hypothetical protein KAT00_03420 [Planctomycetes bacterium]|nr:hypothetical protein [Planctomycetota bacterium]